ncbi:WD domain, G-beta repeat [Musa troglodytarum]|uniref:WD domain, G-beta repeat n=1 Tax=Musa troglodytarum TaxID=320322 RepID=A0A9E7EGN9_9LILI|nr:WD domain, G-beta repeat [Musa troglodytarum]
MSNYPLRRLGKYNGTILESDGPLCCRHNNDSPLARSPLGSRLSAISSFCEGRGCSPTNTNRHSCEGPPLRFLLRRCLRRSGLLFDEHERAQLRGSGLLSDENERAQLRGSSPSIFIAPVSLWFRLENMSSSCSRRVEYDRFIPFRSAMDMDYAHRSVMLRENLHRAKLPQFDEAIRLQKKQQRRIPKEPERVLVLNGMLVDDGLNLLDWGSNNVLAIGLEDAVYLWDAANDLKWSGLGGLDKLVHIWDACMPVSRHHPRQRQWLHRISSHTSIVKAQPAGFWWRSQ